MVSKNGLFTLKLSVHEIFDPEKDLKLLIPKSNFEFL